MSAIEATEGTPENGRAPKDDLYRMVLLPLAVRAGAGAGGAPQLAGHFAVFDTWTRINSSWEHFSGGPFMERFAPGAFKKTLRESRDKIRVLLNHGYDPELGDRPIAAITDLREDDEGAYYEADLLDGVPDLVTAGLRAGQYGASFRFSVMRELWDDNPGESEDNPLGLPERTVKDAKVMEFGPVTFPAYWEASAGLRYAMRSSTDHFFVARQADAEHRRALFVPANPAPDLSTRSEERAAETEHTDDVTDATRVNDAAPSTTDAAREGTSATERRESNRPHTGGGLTPQDLEPWGRHRKATHPWDL